MHMTTQPSPVLHLTCLKLKVVIARINEYSETIRQSHIVYELKIMASASNQADTWFESSQDPMLRVLFSGRNSEHLDFLQN